MKHPVQVRRSSKFGRVVYVAMLIALTAPPVLAEWPQWGGPNMDFAADAHSLAKEWPDSGPKQVWKRDLGEGYSAVLVEGDRLYTMYRADEKEIVIALAAGTGKTIWEHRYDSAPAEGHADQFGRGPRSTPLLVGDRLYTIGVSGKMFCLNKHDGTPYWSHDLWKDFGGSVLNHGYSSSPIVYKDTVVVLSGGEDASIIAFDKGSGDVRWKSLSFKNSYSTPKIIKLDGKDQLVTFMADEIIGVDPTDGRLEWRYEIGNQWGQNICMPTWDEESNIMFFSTSGPGSRGVKLTRNGDKVDVEELWKTRKVRFYHVTSVRIGDYVYGSSGSGTPNLFAAINMKTGKIAWRKRGFAMALTVLADGRLIILDEEGQLAIATATPDDLEIHSKVSLLEDVAWTVPTIVGHTMYVRDKKAIMALDLS